ncbi:MAG TPA: alpha-ketoglutarate-dependent dioxygenase AlkB [Rhizomicrobium sp.]|nr:alpha-ketoglutarate-dependent dioxygenase AlkB [Rhizomicrobium sp.]
MVAKRTIAPDVFLWREKFSALAQKTLLDDVLEKLKDAPLYRPVMPGTAKPFSVEESNFGTLGWVSDKAGYRYQSTHPITGMPWPAIPQALLDLWAQINPLPAPQCCLINLYRAGAKMGLHQDRDEKDVSAAVIGVSLGDAAVFRIGQAIRGGKTVSVTLASGDVIAFGGRARLAYHGIDCIKPGTSRLLPGGGRLSLTLRRVTEPAVGRTNP